MSKQRLVFVMMVGGAIAALVGCELAVEFDRSKIPADSTDAGALDVFAPGDGSGGTDSGSGGTDSGNGGTDGGNGGTDSGGTDSGAVDASFDSSVDSSFDANDQ